MSYLGHDVLELNYNRVGAFEERLRRKFVLLSSKTGRRIADVDRGRRRLDHRSATDAGAGRTPGGRRAGLGGASAL